jgi:hypothetical protein
VTTVTGIGVATGRFMPTGSDSSQRDRPNATGAAPPVLGGHPRLRLVRGDFANGNVATGFSFSTKAFPIRQPRSSRGSLREALGNAVSSYFACGRSSICVSVASSTATRLYSIGMYSLFAHNGAKSA